MIKLRRHQQAMMDETLEQLMSGKQHILRTINPASGKHDEFMKLVARKNESLRNAVLAESNNWPDFCLYDEISPLSAADLREADQKFRLQKYRGAMAKSPTLVDVKRWLKQSTFTLNRVQRHPSLMTIDDWRAIGVVDVYYKAAYTHAQPQVANFNRLLTIYWHNYYMDDLQGTFNDDTLSLLANGCKVDAYELFNTVPRLTYVRYCIAKAIIHRGNDDADSTH